MRQGAKGWVITRPAGTKEVWSHEAKRMVTKTLYKEEIIKSCYCLSRGLGNRCLTHRRELRPEGMRKGHFMQ
jgi:hypothetical protein